MRLFVISVLDKKTNKLEKVQIYHRNKSSAAKYLQDHWWENSAYEYKIIKIEEASCEDFNSIYSF